MFVTRLISGIVLVAVALLTICSGGWILYGTLTIVSLIGMFELYRVMKLEKTPLAAVGYLAAALYYGFVWFEKEDLMMLMGNLMQWKFRVPSVFKGALRTMTEKTVHDVCTKTVWKKDDVHKTAMAVRQYKERLGYSEQWMTEYVYNVVLLAKKEPKSKATEEK
mgnify:CR=1 FL=1